MPRRNEPSHKQQKSKRSREHHKQAEFAFGQRGRWVGHPSHISYRKNRAYRFVRKDWSKLMPGQEIKAISIWQPWASLIASGEKQYETRNWATSYRGLLAIHAAKRWTGEEFSSAMYLKHRCGVLPGFPDVPLPLGAVVAVARLANVVPVEMVIQHISATEHTLGNFQMGRYAWELEVVHVFDEPVQATGAQGLWTWKWIR